MATRSELPVRVAVSKKSYLRYATWLKDDRGEEFWAELDLGEYVPRDDDREYILRQGDRPDTLAKVIYNDERLKWVLLWANGIRLAEVEFYPGRSITVPNRRYVLRELLAGG